MHINFPIENYEDKYTISDEGVIYSVKTKKPLKMLNIQGFNTITIPLIEGGTKRFKVDKLVALAFKKNEKKEIVIHEDGNNLNDNPNNLKWYNVIEYLSEKFGSNWKKIDDVDGHYYIAKDGRLWGLKMRDMCKSQDHAGYPSYNIGYPKQTFFHIHRLLALSFIPNPNNYSFVMHKDGDPQNYSIDNIVWVSNSSAMEKLAKAPVERKRQEKCEPPIDGVELKENKNYLITPHGEIYSKRNRCFSQLRPNLSGYLRVTLGSNKLFFVHKLVAETFIPNPDKKLQVNHKDLDKTNNSVENLEWVTASENVLHSKMYNPEGFKKTQKPVVQCNLNGEQIRTFEGIKVASRETGVNSGSITKCCKGEKPTAGGFTWKYI